ncbi:MAG: hypothetical protein ABSE89_10100 [Sedimentisphaerales bacterium]
MTNSDNDDLNKQATGSKVQKEADVYEDEINLIDYFLILWKRRFFILTEWALPALVIGLVFSHPPTYYKTTCCSINLDEKNYKILLN